MLHQHWPLRTSARWCYFSHGELSRGGPQKAGGVGVQGGRGDSAVHWLSALTVSRASRIDTYLPDSKPFEMKWETAPFAKTMRRTGDNWWFNRVEKKHSKQLQWQMKLEIN